MRTVRTSTLLLALLAILAAPWIPRGLASEGPPPMLDAAALHLALEKLTVVGSVLFIAAHPDDENTAMLTWLENEKRVRAGYLSLTRGDGGQNLIGDEQGDLLGVIRTQELLAARRIDGAEQFFARAVDFGYSKGPDETLDKWGHEEVLSDVVRVIRSFQPDVIIMRFPTTGEGRHGHHTASAILAVEAFEAAADPDRFADPLGGLTPWQPKRLLWNYFHWAAPPTGEEAKAFVVVDLGAYNALLGRSYTELAALSRSMHKSQGFGSAERRGASPNYLKWIAGEPVASDIFEGVDLTWNRIPGGAEIGRILEGVHRQHDPREPSASLSELLRAREAIGRLLAGEAGRTHGVLLRHKAREIDEVIRSSAGLWLEAMATAHTLSPGDSIRIDVIAINRSSTPIRLSAVRSGTVALASRPDSLLRENQPLSVRLEGIVPPDLDWKATQPYWLRRAVDGGLHQVDDPARIGAPENEPVFEVTFEVNLAGQTLEYTIPVLYRWVDRVRGEMHRRVVVAPEVTLALDEKVYLFPDAKPRPVRLHLEARDAVAGTARLTLPSGWRSDPAAHEVEIGAGASRDVVFLVTPGLDGSPLGATFSVGDRTWSRGMTVIDHPHLPIQTVFPEARSTVLRLDLARVGESVGYVMGPGDEVPAALAQMGYEVSQLSDGDLASGDLSAYDAIVIGVRAYNSRDGLKRASKRLLDYVEAGGTLVVQYNTADATLHKPFAPYPLTIGRGRITVEEAPIEFTDPAASLLHHPNRITDGDFDGWVQERGLYFASEWGPEYAAVLSGADPGEEPLAGGLLWAPHGKGIFIYTGYAFFRQLPAGVPGAYRLFANLVSARGPGAD